MKKYLIVIVAFIVVAGISNSLFAQHIYIKTDILGPLVENPFSIGFEKNNRKPGSFVISLEGGYYMRDKGYDFEQVNWRKKITGFGIVPEYRRYLRYTSNMNRPKGVFIGTYAKILKLKYTQEWETSKADVTEKNWAFGIGLNAGYKYKKPYSHFFMEAVLGAGIGVIDFDNFDNDYFPDHFLLARFEFCIGYAFQ
ncbi:MAG: DUF3575 domain-containing protein [Bacteroidota bacterium]|nr:DUF3575 domain-containing protein [Bacteroidota bacterium]